MLRPNAGYRKLFDQLIQQFSDSHTREPLFEELLNIYKELNVLDPPVYDKVPLIPKEAHPKEKSPNIPDAFRPPLVPTDKRESKVPSKG